MKWISFINLIDFTNAILLNLIHNYMPVIRILALHVTEAFGDFQSIISDHMPTGILGFLDPVLKSQNSCCISPSVVSNFQQLLRCVSSQVAEAVKSDDISHQRFHRSFHYHSCRRWFNLLTTKIEKGKKNSPLPPSNNKQDKR